MTEPETQCNLPCIRDLTELDLTPQDRAALMVHVFEVSGPFSTREIAVAFGLSMRGARAMLNRLSRVVPLVRESDRGRWYLLK